VNGGNPTSRERLGPKRPVLIFDGDCAFCRRWVERWKAMTGERIEYVPAEQAVKRFPSIPPEVMADAVWLFESDGRLSRGAAAVSCMLCIGAKRRGYFWAYKHLPWAASIAEYFYGVVSEHRDIADRLDRWLLPNPNTLRRSYAHTRAIFLRALGIIYLIAFLSLWVQIDGLVGSKGILPVGNWLANASEQFSDLSPFMRFLHVPTLCWINSSDGFLHFLCAGGAVLSGILIAGYLPAPVLFLLWLFYLSLVHAGQVFLGFQWDALLLEAGFLSIFFAPLAPKLRPALFIRRQQSANPSRPSGLVLLLLRWLLFRLMILSGLVKLIATNPAWRDLTAMRYHYETQPLPTWTSWYAHLAPDWFHAKSVIAVLIIEAGVPILFFATRRLRIFACIVTVLFQLLIAATGNFGFFNLLTIVLCMLLLDDSVWARLKIRVTKTPAYSPGWRWPAILLWPLAIAIFFLSLVPALTRLRRVDPIPPFMVEAYVAVAPFMSINSYGLFEDMTTRRPEIIVEGSNDGAHWLAYEFKWKPGDINRRPQFCIPHMPRLDWQMWFAALALDQGQLDYWVPAFLRRLQEGSPQVLKMMGSNPFADHPPKYLRLSLYDYSFTTYSERAQTGAWWRRVLLWSSTLKPESPQAP
jgi:predicted DCC family thiol-disulfide oxidoreductase YuxK